MSTEEPGTEGKEGRDEGEGVGERSAGVEEKVELRASDEDKERGRGPPEGCLDRPTKRDEC